ncbi:MAG: hypothetical protein MZV64_21180 [Ignavibacteriales bacterium]|nr:hypothetical protein [Ignavibacteriales bacterium]
MDYFGDAALSVAVGKISDDKQKLLDVTEKSLYAMVLSKLHWIIVFMIFLIAVQKYVEANGFSIVKRFVRAWCW